MRLLGLTAAVASLLHVVVCAPAGVVLDAPEDPVEKRSEDSFRLADTGARDADSTTKYFHEPGSDDILGHYDSRFFKGAVDYDTRTDTLHHLMRSYLMFFREKGLETWIAHGTLLGWWWNGQILPWDWDIDTQVSGETLAYMGVYLNQTIYHYDSSKAPSIESRSTSSEHPKRAIDFDASPIQRTYLLDVNPYSTQRYQGDGMNIIDARWIDIRTGLYIDITGLSEVHPESEPGIWQCKNEHRYRTRDLYPMRESVYEGVPAKIPYNYEGILVEEYGMRSVVLTEYEGHEWDEEQRLWVRKPETGLRSPAKKNDAKYEADREMGLSKRSWLGGLWRR